MQSLPTLTYADTYTVCRHARMQTDILTRIKIYTYHEQYADGYDRGLVLHKYLVRINPLGNARVQYKPVNYNSSSNRNIEAP